MRIISTKRLREFWAKYPDAERPLSDWHKVVEHANWRTPADVKRTFGHASFVGHVVVFKIGGNRYRLTVNARYESHAVHVRRVMTHEEHDDHHLTLGDGQRVRPQNGRRTESIDRRRPHLGRDCQPSCD